MEVDPNLIKIVCDTLVVLATGAGVEREFSKSRRVVIGRGVGSILVPSRTL